MGNNPISKIDKDGGQTVGCGFCNAIPTEAWRMDGWRQPATQKETEEWAVTMMSEMGKAYIEVMAFAASEGLGEVAIPGAAFLLSRAGKYLELGNILKYFNRLKGVKAGAKLSTNSVKLAKQLASEAQMAESGRIIIGSGKLTEAARLAKQYGGNAADWVKKSSSSFTKNGTTFETHWYENISTGLKTEFKTKFP